MARSPESLRGNTTDFRAPPPSPVAPGRRSSFANDDVLADFLEHSLRVPDLILPDRVFPRQNPIQNPPKLDFQLLNSAEDEATAATFDSIGQIGCFQLVNHGIPSELIRSVSSAGSGVFTIPPEKKRAVSRSPEKPYGFVEYHCEEERDTSEEFIWRRDQALKLEMEGLWPTEYSKFSKKMERLLMAIENVAGSLLQVLQQINQRRWTINKNVTMQEEELDGPICHLYKHCRNMPTDDQSTSSLKYDVIRTLVRGSEYSHALCLHVCRGSSEFHVYSKKGWVSFHPDEDALVITIGDKLQAWSGGQCKHVIGRPIFTSEEDSISMAFLYSPPNNIMANSVKENKGKSVSLGQQVVLSLCLSLVYHVLVYMYGKF
ncbi:hypothetical protein RJ640_008559 [Escallonia rubra]|uniref:Uncharacterized protein n=1 Tax=Escallonia rubra TaxID=112253 RepID=A0AA88QXF7_9ASTE|nr:hypothetical protein RJ640_008559 [Escallonia rubra]